MENPVHLAYAVGKLVVQIDGDTQLNLQRGGLAAAEGAEEFIACQTAQLIWGSVIDKLRAVPDLHRQLGEKLRHCGDGLLLGHLWAEGIRRLIMRLGSHIKIYEVAVGCRVCEGDGLCHGIAGHYVLEAVKQVGLRVLAAGLEIEAACKALKGDRRSGGKRRG